MIDSRMRRSALALAGLILAAMLSSCTSQPAAPAAATAPATEATAPQQSGAVQAPAMAEAPQKITPQQYEDQFVATQAAHQLIDVRTPEEYQSGHIAGSINIPVESLQQRIGEVSKDSPVVVYCHSGRRSAIAVQILEGAGYRGIYDLGGIQAWQAAGFPVD